MSNCYSTQPGYFKEKIHRKEKNSSQTIKVSGHFDKYKFAEKTIWRDKFDEE